jgi:transcriptional regulator with XRE-family HTH domain
VQKTIYTPAYRKMIERLRDRRRALGLSQREVARRLNMQRSFVAKVEIAESRLDLCQFVRIARLYGLRASKLMRQLEGEMSEGDDPLYLLAVFEHGAAPTARLAQVGDVTSARCWSCVHSCEHAPISTNEHGQTRQVQILVGQPTQFLVAHRLRAAFPCRYPTTICANRSKSLSKGAIFGGCPIREISREIQGAKIGWCGPLCAGWRATIGVPAAVVRPSPMEVSDASDACLRPCPCQKGCIIERLRGASLLSPYENSPHQPHENPRSETGGRTSAKKETGSSE